MIPVGHAKADPVVLTEQKKKEPVDEVLQETDWADVDLPKVQLNGLDVDF